MIRAISLTLILCAGPAVADMLVAARTLRPQSILQPGDVMLVPGVAGGVLSSEEEALGQETRVVLYEGRAIRATDVGPVTLVERNQIVPLAYRSGALTILTDGRALDRGGAGDVIRVMNLSSRSTVTGIVTADGYIRVGADASAISD